MKKLKDEIKELLFQMKDYRYKLHKMEIKLREMQEKCPHDEGINPPLTFGPRYVTCKICGKDMGRYCKVSITQMCEYEDEPIDYHSKCIHCGKLWEDG